MAKKTAKKTVVSTQPTPSQVRPLTNIERQYIQEHYYKDKLTLEDLVKELPGVDLNDIHACVKGMPAPSKAGETAQERQNALSQLPSAGQFMGRDPARGVAVMTEAASEIADARKVVAVPSNDAMARSRPDQIHIINPNKRVR